MTNREPGQGHQAASTVGRLRQTYGQFIRYALLGLFMNSLGYLLFALATAAGLGAKLSMSVIYCTGVALNFLLSRRWVFNQRSAGAMTFASYVFVYFLGYLLNYALLALFVDHLGWNHLIVQAFSICAVAVFLFGALKLLVFRQADAPGRNAA